MDQARAQLALGVIRAARAEGEEDDAQSLTAFEGALANFSAARALAGPGTLRLDATYDLGTAELFRGERWRARIPEVSGQQVPPGAAPGLPGMPPAAAPGGPDDGPPPPDPLAEARKHYLEARTWLGERLRADARDADTRANLELVQRRLRELEKIEEEREKQEQENQDQQDQENKDDNQDKQDQQKKDQQDKDPENKDPKDPEQKDQPPQDPKDPQDQKDGQQDPKQQEKPKEEQGEQKQQEPAEQEQKDPQSGQPEGEPEERVLTREEVMQLLDRLAELEKQQKALEAQLRAKRSKAKRDW